MLLGNVQRAEKPPNLQGRSGVSPETMIPHTSIPRGAPDEERRPHGAADFDAVFREHYGPMVRSLAVATGDREAAADAVQDAFTRAYVRWRRISRYDDPAGWIRHVALNRLRDHFRRADRGKRAVDRLATRDALVVDPPEPPAEDHGLLDALAQLPRQQRTAAALFYVEQLSVQEVADSMKLSTGAVKYHLHAARTALRDQVSAP